MATKRYVFKKWDNSQEFAECFYCGKKTLFFISDRKTGEDFFCCSECAYKKHKIKRLGNLLKKYPLRQKKAILEQNSPLKKSENAREWAVSDRQEVLENV